ncbi:hypothetical protein [Hymenobacter cavernae]|uniref:Uncharacterized protein n=1 Tax=Hymenobacter cavernae TaxID=2044852 RepID=A0ABQ1TX76_9BACT|nr:hypothetical protein [Hymenobacter cavernae]GGF05922.1 hypothetical protein GCM10011383_16330 [Hymenobacter cavernae]
MEKHKSNSSSKSNQKESTAQGPDALQHASVDPESRGNDGANVQNLNQNGLNETGNHTRNNAPGGGDSEQERTTQANKPRHNPNPSQQNNK